MWHSRPPRDPPPLHGKNYLKFPFWLFDTLPYTIAGKSCLVFRIINYWNVFKIHSIQELQWCVLGYGGAVTQTVSGGGRKSVRNSSSYFTFPLLPLQMYRVHHFCWQWTLVLLSAMKNYSLGAASFWNAKRAHIRWKYTTIYTSLHCPDSLLHRSTLLLFHTSWWVVGVHQLQWEGLQNHGDMGSKLICESVQVESKVSWYCWKRASELEPGKSIDSSVFFSSWPCIHLVMNKCLVSLHWEVRPQQRPVFFCQGQLYLAIVTPFC